MDEEPTVVNNLLSATRSASLLARRTELMEALCSIDMVGTPEQVNTAVGMFHLLKGKLDMIDEIINDHNETADELQRVEAAYG